MSRGTFCSIVITAGAGTALKSKKISKNFKKIFVLKKYSQVVSVWKSQKIVFLGEIGLQFFASHRSAFFSIISRLAPVDRKILTGHLDGFIKKIF